MRMFIERMAAGMVLALFIGLASCAFAGEYAGAPSALGMLPDGVLRDALSQYAPDYDALPRRRQVRAYVNIYKALHDGAEPRLPASDSALLDMAGSAAPGPDPRGSGGDPEYYDPYAPGGWFYDDMPFGALSPFYDDYWGINGVPEQFFHPGPGRARYNSREFGFGPAGR